MLSKNMITMQKDVFSHDIPTVVKGLLFLLSCLITSWVIERTSILLEVNSVKPHIKADGSEFDIN